MPMTHPAMLFTDPKSVRHIPQEVNNFCIGHKMISYGLSRGPHRARLREGTRFPWRSR